MARDAGTETAAVIAGADEKAAGVKAETAKAKLVPPGRPGVHRVLNGKAAEPGKKVVPSETGKAAKVRAANANAANVKAANVKAANAKVANVKAANAKAASVKAAKLRADKARHTGQAGQAGHTGQAAVNRTLTQ